MNKLKIRSIKDFSIFVWLFLATVFAILFSQIYLQSKNEQSSQIKDSLDNIYLKKTLEELTSNLEPRYNTKNYLSKAGDTYESILNSLELNKNEKKIILETIAKEKLLNVLRVNQKFTFKFDNLSNERIMQFKIETDRKNEIVFIKQTNQEGFKSKKIKKNYTKKLVYKETVIETSLYNSAINLGIKPNIIIEFARLYGFQVDFQRDIWKGDSFQIIYEQFENEDGSLIENGDIIFSNLNTQGNDLNLYKFELGKNEIDYFDENGKSMKKTLMKTPINGARLSSPFGKRKHPILGFTKMHAGTDFAAPTGTPIMASGDGVVTRAQWCGGGGNCVKIKHNSVYQTVYAHMSKFGRGIKKGVRVKQGQIIGYVGSTGLSTGPHLHYEVIENGRKINSQKLKLPSGKTLKGKERNKFEVNKIKIDVLKSELIASLN